MCFSVRSFLVKSHHLITNPMQKLMNDIILSFFLFDLEKYKSETLRNFVANITGVNTHEADNWQEYPSAGRILGLFRGYLLFRYSSLTSRHSRFMVTVSRYSRTSVVQYSPSRLLRSVTAHGVHRSLNTTRTRPLVCSLLTSVSVAFDQKILSPRRPSLPNQSNVDHPPRRVFPAGTLAVGTISSHR